MFITQSPVCIGTFQHQCAERGCGEWEECNDYTGGCPREEAGWIRGRFYCKDHAEERWP